jgi:hypothetical protein
MTLTRLSIAYISHVLRLYLSDEARHPRYSSPNHGAYRQASHSFFYLCSLLGPLWVPVITLRCKRMLTGQTVYLLSWVKALAALVTISVPHLIYSLLSYSMTLTVCPVLIIYSPG